MQLFWQIGFLVAVAAVFFAAFSMQAKQKYLFALCLLLVAGLALRLFSGFDMYLHPWDERYHALVAKNMLHNPMVPMLYTDSIIPLDYRNWCACGVWLHKQPVPLWMMSAGIALFGENELAVRLPSILFSTVGIWLIYMLAMQFYSRRVAFLSAFLFAIHGLILDITAGRVATDHIDLFFLIFILAAVFASAKAVKTKHWTYPLLSGLFIGMAILSKWLPALIVFGIWGLLAYRKISLRQAFLQFSIMAVVCIAVALPWQVYIFTRYPAEAAWEASFNMRHITEVLDSNSGPFYYHFAKMGMLFGELIYLALLWFVVKSVRMKNNNTRWAWLGWILVPYIFFSIPMTKMQAYTLFTAPALFILTALFADYLLRVKSRFKAKWLVWIVVVLLFALPVRYSIERLKIFEEQERQPPWTTDIKQLRDQLNGGDGKTVIFNASHPIETMFYIDCIAYDFTPSAGGIEKIEKQGYRVIVLPD
ncbi:MAG: glycosyltransferase family 39 protein [Bacteroidales bacterium]|nr:glycosyltransferase family 39 protein [Bacteroidales bacterium]